MKTLAKLLMGHDVLRGIYEGLVISAVMISIVGIIYFFFVQLATYGW